MTLPFANTPDFFGWLWAIIVIIPITITIVFVGVLFYFIVKDEYYENSSCIT